ncbi:MAG TPA: hypothetical protein PKE47_04740, partial [Verrucomicrobiota bacterium]|nr:hypothetical protein [Verrucomicrobiota bacterium]
PGRMIFVKRTLCWAAGLLAAACAGGQELPAPDESPDDAPAWAFSVSAAVYVVKDDRDFFQPTLMADRDWLHLEARYSYENLDTGSVWVGYNFAGEGAVDWSVTPMLGGVFGRTTGVSPGYRGALHWWRLDLFSEGQYVVDAADTDDNFFYNWSELSLSPAEWFRFGLAAQRTRVYRSDLDTQRGFLVGVAWATASLTAYVFNPEDDDERLFVISLGVEF